MAEVTVTAVVNLRITDSEWRLIMRALAAFAGVKISTTAGQRKEAETLNRQLLTQRQTDLRDQLKVAEDALERANRESEDPDGSAAVAMAAFHVGKRLGEASAEPE